MVCAARGDTAAPTPSQASRMPPLSERRVFMSPGPRASSVPTGPECSRSYAKELATALAIFGYRTVTNAVSRRACDVGARLEQSILLAFLPEVLARDAQDLGRLLDVTARLPEGGANVFALGVRERQALG